MEKTKVKQVTREALAREPAIEWYLNRRKIISNHSLQRDTILELYQN